MSSEYNYSTSQTLNHSFRSSFSFKHGQPEMRAFSPKSEQSLLERSVLVIGEDKAVPT